MLAKQITVNFYEMHATNVFCKKMNFLKRVEHDSNLEVRCEKVNSKSSR